ncbi:hypothetical protein [Streptomyces sp. NPDC052610]|uniref:hypothetical protein n=1 Tax=Streptomyces sp. NPDC052610 TaxID=3154952 RepID=UPI003432EB22
MTTPQLKALLLRDTDMPQTDGTSEQAPAPEYPRIASKRPDCQKVLDALVMHDASTSVIQDWWQDDRWSARTWLASFSGTGAQEQFRLLEEGLESCESLQGKTPEGRLDSRVAVSTAPALGDEAVAFELSMEGPDGTTLTDRHVFVRVGSLTADISDRGTEHTAPFPLDALVDKQVARLTRSPSA